MSLLGGPEISLREFAELYDEGVVLLDCREPEEYVEGHVPGAVLVPLGSIAEAAAELPRDAPVFVICRSGNRSLGAAAYLQRAGVDAFSVAEGTLGWVRLGKAVVSGFDGGSARSLL